MGTACSDLERKKINKSSSTPSKSREKEKKEKPIIKTNNNNRKSCETLPVNKTDETKKKETTKNKTKKSSLSNTIQNSIKKSIKIPNKSYTKLSEQNNYYIVCPECNNVPFIKDFKYEEKSNDFIVLYTCECKYEKEKEKDLKKTYLINLISSDKPPNLTSYFISKEDGDKLLEEAKQKINVFKGFDILEKLIKDNQFNQSVAPAIGIKKKSMNNYKSGVSTSCSQSKCTDSYNIVVSKNVFDDISFEDFNQKINQMGAIEEEEDIKEYHHIKTLNGHRDRVVSLIQLHSGLIATGSYDSTIRIWDVEDYSCVKIFKIKETIIFCLLEFIPNFILFGTNKNNIGLWDSNSEDNLQSFIFSGHELWVNSLVKCDDNCFASASNDKTIKIWNYYNKNCIRTIEAHEDCILCLIKLINGNLCSGGADLMIKIWDWNNGSCIYTLVGHRNWINCLIQLEDGQIVSGSVDKTIKFWKKYENIETINAHENSVRTLCQINANYIASGSFDNKIKIWNLNNLKCHQTLSGHTSNVTCVIQLNNNNLVSCSTDYSIKIWG